METTCKSLSGPLGLSETVRHETENDEVFGSEVYPTNWGSRF